MITVTRTLNTHRTEFWLIQYKETLTKIATKKNRNRKGGLTNQRYVICKTLKINAADIRFLGNVKIDGNWVSQWATLEELK